ncbi:23S rRNA (uracil(1939)-C(5))-methyltransferase [hydrothermal vent metagenome]|uniref:23S rRNA (Uracil(1939)-C(5))-methyltransferase n=1 Tax=hydrothermal vent metagenome TaxID=652676 RepID=A0A3B0YKC5_9ZZZZ
MARRRNRRGTPRPIDLPAFECVIESLSSDGRGVSHVEGKSVFVAGALPGETVTAKYLRRKRHFDEAIVETIIVESVDRVIPACASFGLCGGCVLQHLKPEKQIEFKLNTLLDNFKRLGNVEPEVVDAAVTASSWGYRRRARLGVRYVHKKEKVLVGFRELQSSFIAQMSRCEILHPVIGEKLESLADLIASLTVYNRIAQIEVAIADKVNALVFRNLEPLSDEDIVKVKSYASDNNFSIYLQSGGPETVSLVHPQQEVLDYSLEDYQVRLEYEPGDFTQVNFEINTKMMAKAMQWLNPNQNDRVLDLFCGIGNFTIPLARCAAYVLGVEGSVAMVDKARHNAQINKLDNIAFEACNLADENLAAEWLQQGFNKVLIDPPRSGAQEILPNIARLNPEIIVYISCHPGSLARDAGILVNEYGYVLKKSTVLDMFPHTAHVESIALFVKTKS